MTARSVGEDLCISFPLCCNPHPIPLLSCHLHFQPPFQQMRSRLPAAPEKGALFPGHSAQQRPPRSAGTSASWAAAGGCWWGHTVGFGVGWWRKGQPFGMSLAGRGVPEQRLLVLPLSPWGTRRQAQRFPAARSSWVGQRQDLPWLQLLFLAGLIKAGHHFQTAFSSSPERTWGCSISLPAAHGGSCCDGNCLQQEPHLAV